MLVKQKVNGNTHRDVAPAKAQQVVNGTKIVERVDPLPVSTVNGRQQSIPKMRRNDHVGERPNDES